jgi:putative spermidine/putrescine transport system permease protein
VTVQATRATLNGTPGDPPDRRRRMPRGWMPYALGGPAAVFLALVVIAPFVNLVILSLYHNTFFGIKENVSLRNYVQIFTQGYYLHEIVHSLLLAVVAAAIALILGVPTAFIAWRAPRPVRTAILLLTLAPILISSVVRTLGWVVALGPGGLADRLLMDLGLGTPRLLGTNAAVLIGFANVFMPFMVLSVMSALRNVDPQLLMAARTLGASELRMWMQIVVPLVSPGMVAGAILVFSLAANSYITPAMLGGGSFSVLPVEIYQQTTVIQNLPLASAIGVVLTLLVVFIVVVQMIIMERRFHTIMVAH